MVANICIQMGEWTDGQMDGWMDEFAGEQY